MPASIRRDKGLSTQPSGVGGTHTRERTHPIHNYPGRILGSTIGAREPGRQSKCVVLLKPHDSGRRTWVLTNQKTLSSPNLRGEEVKALHAGTLNCPNLQGEHTQVSDDSANADGQAGQMDNHSY
jgi:hypothetical protein